MIQSQSLAQTKPRTRNSMPTKQTPSVTTPKAWVVTYILGINSEIWIERQLNSFTAVKPELVYWEIVNESKTLKPIRKHQLKFRLAPKNRLNRWGMLLRRLPQLNFFGSAGKEYRHLCALAEQEKPEVILCHFGHSSLRMLPIAKKYNIPLVAHFHGLDLSSSLKDRWYRWSLLKQHEAFAKIIVVGESQKNWMLNNGVPEEKLHLIPCGVPIDAFQPNERPADRPIRFTTVSRLVPWKGVDISMKAFAKTKKLVPQAAMEIVGEGDSLNELKTLAKELGIEDSVTFAGALTPDQVRDRLQDSDVFLQHSIDHSNGWYEGFGVSITEASAMELPVIVSRCGGIPDQVNHEETGYIVPQHDIEGMAKLMVGLARDSDLRRKMGKAGRERVMENFDTANQVRKLEAVMTEAIANQIKP